MADASKLKAKRSRGSLGTPPGPDEVATSLNSPEVAPSPLPEVAEHQSPVNVLSKVEIPYVRRDGRSARKTHRTLAFATRVTPEFDNEVRDIAEREGLKLVEVLENALEAYKKQQGY
ncbi:hypothetical protein SJZ84_20550 [Hafnia paralvei]|uniref:hypothetical protein n=1 Tax=Hafnia TaxID=568 RepID=UPI00061CF281|nr:MULTISPECIES: hypothetical protein [Hafnia]EHP5273338.1 hypothetical protein [Escherichia coli]KKF38622.1 hypothetical protein PU01_22380 [Hafnia alvei]MBW3474155.1 hypothetical protein [Hafnia alvei]MCE9871547.1 hypothetical protein [Hafnia alvei]MCE9902171.1 hypothetical protein [Hafnia paralvei]